MIGPEHDPLARQFARWREEPVAFVREALRAEPDAWQAEVLQAFPGHQRVALKACKGPGKTCVEAWLIWNFLLTRPYPRVICTSITGDNLRDCLWAELAKWLAKAPILQAQFLWQAQRIVAKAAPETWWASARTWPRDGDASSQADSVAGLHGDYTLAVADEVGDYPDGVVVALEASLSTGIENRLVIAGNPTRTSGPLYRAATTERSRWWLYEITGDPDDPKRAPRISIEWARAQIAQWGPENPWVLVNVFGRFPPTQSDQLLGPEDVAKATKRRYQEGDLSLAAKVIGVDCARFGDDRSVIFPRQGRVALQPVVFRGLTTTELAERVVQYAQKWAPDAVFVDGGGLGAGVVDHARSLGLPVIEINFGGRPSDVDRYENRRSEMWSRMADWVKEGGGALPDLPELTEELCAPTYWHDKRQRVCLEPKDQIKARMGGRSPDLADGLALTFAAPANPKRGPLEEQLQHARSMQRVAADWDPYSEAHLG